MAVSSTSTRTSVGSDAGSPTFGSCCTKSDAASACCHDSSSSTPSMRTGTEIRRACKVFAVGAGWATRFDPDARTRSAAPSGPLVSPLSTPADYTVRALPANASSAQVTIAARSIDARIRLPLDELDLLLRLDRDLDGRVSDAELDAARAAIAAYVTRHLHVAADGQPLPLSVGAVAIRANAGGSSIEAETRAVAASRIGSITIGSDFLTEIDLTHKTAAEIYINGRVETFSFQPGVTSQRQIGVDWLMSAVLVLAAVVVIGALWLARRRRPAILAAVVALAASAASADVIMSASGLNTTLKTLERLVRDGGPEATFKLGAEADALASLMNQEVESHGMQERALLDLALSRTKELGIGIAYNREKKKFFYDGAAFSEYLKAMPRGPHAEAASFQLLAYQFYQSPATDIPALTAAVESTKRFLAGYPASKANVEARLFLAVDYRDLYRRYLAANAAANAAKYRALAREACRAIVSHYPRAEQADAARQLLRGLEPTP